MWDVKMEMTMFWERKLAEFYMNYVGCKVFADIVASIWRKGFIWTMWDVKMIVSGERSNSSQVLYELCGM